MFEPNNRQHCQPTLLIRKIDGFGVQGTTFSQGLTDKDRQRQTKTDKDRQRQTKTDKDRQRQTHALHASVAS
jgi:hypothetical protein